MKDICKNCRHCKTCRSPCRPIELYLAENNLSVFEKTFTNKDGEKVSIVFARSRETQQSMLSIGVDKAGDPRLSTREAQAFSTENESPFASFEPKLKQTGIFIDRFFHNFSYKDLAVKYDISRDAAIKIYHAATKRLLEVLEALDGKKDLRNLDHWKKQVDERSGSLPKGQKWFLLNKLFGFRPSEIAKMENLKGSSSVRQLIIRVSDQLKAGEINLIDATAEDAEAAKARLDANRKKRRERHARKKALSK